MVTLLIAFYEWLTNTRSKIERKFMQVDCYGEYLDLHRNIKYFSRLIDLPALEDEVEAFWADWFWKVSGVDDYCEKLNTAIRDRRMQLRKAQGIRLTREMLYQ